MSITIERMKPRLLDVAKLRKELSVYEPLSERGFPVNKDVKFRVEPGWNTGDLDNPQGPVGVYVQIPAQETEIQLTREAVLQATSLAGLSAGYVLKSPSRLTRDALNYWYGEGFSDKSQFQVLSVDQPRPDGVELPLGVAVTRGSIRPFSSLQLLDVAVARICEKYGCREEDLLVDYKRRCTLPYTAFALIVPEIVRQMTGTGLDDDPWSAGVRITNSPIGKGQTAAEGYLFRYTCTNGEISVGANAGQWSRRQGQGDEVYSWAADAVDQVLGGLEPELDKAQRLVEVPVDGAANDVLADLFEHFRLPVPVREAITENMVEMTALNMYHLKAAVTQAANDMELPVATQELIMRVGGHVNHAVSDRCDSCHQILRRAKRAQQNAEAVASQN